MINNLDSNNNNNNNNKDDNNTSLHSGHLLSQVEGHFSRISHDTRDPLRLDRDSSTALRTSGEDSPLSSKTPGRNNKRINTLTSALLDKVSVQIRQNFMDPCMGNTFPYQEQIDRQLIWQRNSLYTAPSRFSNGGSGVFAARRLRANERLGYYVGHITPHSIPILDTQVNDYNLFINLPNIPTFEVDGSAFLAQDEGILARINEYLWYTTADDGLTRNNCKLMSGTASGQLITTRVIKAGEELTLHLGTAYNWTHYIKFLCHNAITVLRHFSHHTGQDFQSQLLALDHNLRETDLTSQSSQDSDIQLLYSKIRNTSLMDTTKLTTKLPLIFSRWLDAVLSMKTIALCTRFRHAFKPGRILPKWIRLQGHKYRQIKDPPQQSLPLIAIRSTKFAQSGRGESTDYGDVFTAESVIADSISPASPSSRSEAAYTFSDDRPTLSACPVTSPATSVISHSSIQSSPSSDHCCDLSSPTGSILTVEPEQITERRFNLKPREANVVHDYSHYFQSLTFAEGDGPLIDSGSLSHQRMRVATLNINGLRGDKIPNIVWLIQHYQIDVLTLVDTKCRDNTSNFFSKVFRAYLPDDTIIHSPTPMVFNSREEAISVHGGITMILSPRSAAHMSPPIRDPLKLGIGLKVCIKDAHMTTAIIGMYWPSTGGGADSNTLHVRVKTELENSGLDISPETYVQQLADKWADSRLISRAILCGDLNASWSPRRGRSRDKTFREWADSGAWTTDDVDMHEPHQHTYYSGENSSRIDHILVRNPQSDMLFAISKTAQWNTVTDHRPLIAELSANWEAVSAIRKTPLWTTIRFTGKDSDLVSLYQDELTTLMDSNPSLHEIIDSSVRILSHATSSGKIRKRTRKFFDGWSPAFQYLKLKHHFVTRIQKTVRIWRLRPNPKTYAYVEGQVARQCDEWQRLITAYQLHDWEGDDEYGATSWKHRHLSRITAELTTDIIVKVKSLLHGNQRTQMRNNISIHTKRLETERASGKIGGMIKYLLGSKRAFQQSDHLVASDGTFLKADDAIHHELTTEMARSYSLEQEAALAVLGPDINTWTRAAFQEVIQDTLPEPLWHTADALWHGFTFLHTATDGANTYHQQLLDRFNQLTPPTFEEFNSAITSLKKDSAPGVSRLTYPMIKAWPQVVRRQVYDDLLTHWNNGTFPPYWQTRYMCLIPKSGGDLTAANMRPIMLCEPLRKLWMKIILTPIFQFWDTQHFLSSSQYGYRMGRSTAATSLHVSNNLEESEEDNANIAFSSWDIQKAFDRVTPEMQRLLYTRLGVPQHIIHWILGVDSTGTTIVRTNWSVHHCNSGRNSKFQDISVSTTSDVSTFTPQQGMGQGDIPSAPAWNGFLDTLARSLEHYSSSHPTFYSRSSTTMSAAITSMFADDIIDITSSLHDLAAHGDVVCAWAMMVHTRVASNKLRAFFLDRHNNSTPTSDLNIRNYGEQEPAVAVVNKPGIDSFKHLGVVHSIDNSGSHQFELSKLNVLRSVNAIKTKRWRSYISPEAAMDSLSKVTRAQECYRGALSPWSLRLTQQLDSPVNSFIRTITHNMRGFPNALIHLPRHLGGLGVLSVSTSIQKSKYAMMQRGILAGAVDAHTIFGHINRQLRITHRPTRGFSYPVSYCHNTSWATSLIEFGRQSGLTLWTGGRNPIGTSEEPIANYLPRDPNGPLNDDLWHKLVKYGLTLLGDLMTTTGWINLVTLDIQQLDHYLPRYDSIKFFNLITEGQTWFLPQQHNNQLVIAEVLGFELPRIMVRFWTASTPRHLRLSHLIGHKFLTSLDQRFGSGSSIYLIESDLRAATKVIMSADFKERDNTLSRQLQYCYPGICAPQIHLPDLTEHTRFYDIPSWLSILRAHIRHSFSNAELDFDAQQYEVFTDASWSLDNTDPRMLVLHHSLVRRHAYGSLVFMANANWNSKVVVVVQVDLQEQNFKSAFEIELLMIVIAGLATQGNHIQIKSDCKSAVDMVRSPHLLHHRVHHEQFNLLQIARKLLIHNRTSHVKAHIERSKSDSQQWTRDNWGNYIADVAASSEMRNLKRLKPFIFQRTTLLFRTFLLSDILPTLSERAPLSWRTPDGNIALSSIQTAYHNELLKTYLQSRDADNPRQGGDTRPLWSTIQTHSHSNHSNLSKLSISAAAGMCRLIFDKHFHGRNRRHVSTDVALTNCTLCQQPDSRRHILLECQHDSAIIIREEAIRATNLLVEKCSHMPLTYDFGHIFLHLAFHDEHGDYLWTSTWTAGLLERLTQQLVLHDRHRTRADDKQISKLAIKLGKEFASHALLLLDNSHKAFQASNIKYKAKDRPPSTRLTRLDHPLILPSGQRRLDDYVLLSRPATTTCEIEYNNFQISET